VTTGREGKITEGKLAEGSTYNVLMWVHEYVKVKTLRYSQNGNGMLNPLFVVLPGTGMLDSLPSEDVPYRIVTP
jgi:hypothetical protein